MFKKLFKITGAFFMLVLVLLRDIILLPLVPIEYIFGLNHEEEELTDEEIIALYRNGGNYTDSNKSILDRDNDWYYYYSNRNDR